MALIGQYEAITATKVVAATPMDKTTVSRAAARLSTRGLIERCQDETDRRAAVLRLSDEGRHVFRQVSARALAYEEKLLASLSEGELRSLGTLIEKLDTASVSA